MLNERSRIVLKRLIFGPDETGLDSQNLDVDVGVDVDVDVDVDAHFRFAPMALRLCPFFGCAWRNSET